MASYKETIEAQCSRMPRSIWWWPQYLYHYTDVNHAVSIIDNEWIYDRVTVKKQRLTQTDAASQNVLNVTSDAVKHCGRLYMRPLSPAQFYSEGYKPEEVRHEGYKDASCPVPVFFLLDAVKTLAYPGVFFVECGTAGYYTEEWKTGPKEYAALCFEKIFHHGSTGHDPSILKYRRTEVLREGGIPLRGLLRRIVCRSSAEAGTLLSLMRKQCPAKYETYSRLVVPASAYNSMYLFNRNGMYVNRANVRENQVLIEFNEAGLRYDYCEHSGQSREEGVPVSMAAVISWKDRFGQIIEQSMYEGILNYKVHNAITLDYKNKISDYLTLELWLDNHLMFQDDYYIGNHIVY